MNIEWPDLKHEISDNDWLSLYDPHGVVPSCYGPANRYPEFKGDNTELCELLTRLVDAAIIHGGDNGGPYFVNKAGLHKEMQRVIDYFKAHNIS